MRHQIDRPAYLSRQQQEPVPGPLRIITNEVQHKRLSQISSVMFCKQHQRLQDFGTRLCHQICLVFE